MGSQEYYQIKRNYYNPTFYEVIAVYLKTEYLILEAIVGNNSTFEKNISGKVCKTRMNKHKKLCIDAIGWLTLIRI